MSNGCRLWAVVRERKEMEWAIVISKDRARHGREVGGESESSQVELTV